MKKCKNKEKVKVVNNPVLVDEGVQNGADLGNLEGLKDDLMMRNDGQPEFDNSQVQEPDMSLPDLDVNEESIAQGSFNTNKLNIDDIQEDFDDIQDDLVDNMGNSYEEPETIYDAGYYAESSENVGNYTENEPIDQGYDGNYYDVPDDFGDMGYIDQVDDTQYTDQVDDTQYTDNVTVIDQLGDMLDGDGFGGMPEGDPEGLYGDMNLDVEFDNEVDNFDSKDAEGATEKSNAEADDSEIEFEADGNSADDSDELSDSAGRECVLALVVDNEDPGLVEYARSCGLNANSIFYTVEDAQQFLMLQSNPTRVVVMDTGTGNFISPKIRKDLIDLIGICDEDSRFTVFYTDVVLKSDAMETLDKVAKRVEWIKYQSSLITIATLLSHKERYIRDDMSYMESKVFSADDERILRAYKGYEVDCELENMSPVNLSLSKVAQSIEESVGTDKELAGFEIPKFK